MMRSASPGRTKTVGRAADDDSIIFINSFFSDGGFKPLSASCYDNERLIYQERHGGKLLLLRFGASGWASGWVRKTIDFRGIRCKLQVSCFMFNLLFKNRREGQVLE